MGVKYIIPKNSLALPLRPNKKEDILKTELCDPSRVIFTPDSEWMEKYLIGPAAKTDRVIDSLQNSLDSLRGLVEAQQHVISLIVKDIQELKNLD